MPTTFLRETSAELFLMAAIGLVMGLLGPFGTFAVPIAQRVLVWEALALGGYACFRPVIAAGVVMHERSGMPRLAAIALACAIAAVPTTLLVAFVFGPARADADTLAGSYPYVLLTGALATVIQLAIFRPQPAARRPAPSADPLPEPAAAVPSAAFLDRLPPAHRDLLALEMEDHYVRAHSSSGSTLVLIRMRDAVAELAGIEGARVHRSWWVARAAVTDVVRRDRAVLLRLANGLDVPVARNEAPALRAAGWL